MSAVFSRDKSGGIAGAVMERVNYSSLSLCFLAEVEQRGREQFRRVTIHVSG